MNSENREPPTDRLPGPRRSPSERWERWEFADEATQPLGSSQPVQTQGTMPSGQVFRPSTTPAAPANQGQVLSSHAQAPIEPQPAYREHVTGTLVAHPAEAPLFQPAYLPSPPQMYPQQGQAIAPQPIYQPYPGFHPYAGYPAHPAYGYPAYGWHAQPPQHKRDGYLLAMAITSLVGSSLVLLIGLFFTGILLLATTLPNRTMNSNQQFSVYVAVALFIVVAIIGGSLGLYHSIRSLVKKPSAYFSLPQFWIFLVFYVVVIAIGLMLRSNGQEVAFPVLSAALIILAGLFPALAVASIGVRRLRTRAVKPQKDTWETSWRRFTLAMLSGATLSITLALILELVLLVVIVLLTHTQGMQSMAMCINTPDVQSCQNAGANGVLFLSLAVIAPLVEETVKPLAVILLIGRVRSAAEAFVLGLACGIGFDIVETSLYMAMGNRDWLNVALDRTGSGLLHGFGAAMVGLGWYYLTHTKDFGVRNGLLWAFACWLYAVFQHAVWNGSVSLVLLPGSVGQFFQNWSLNLGFASLSSDVAINIVEALLILAFFLYMTRKLKSKPTAPLEPPALAEHKDAISTPSAAMV
jgi:RsiW-degrading membrane proteinase PrsW (M82 family)